MSIPHTSNIGIPGKYIFRVDLESIQHATSKCCNKNVDIYFIWLYVCWVRNSLDVPYSGMPMFDVWGIVIIPGVLEPGTT
jgi:hypothetical protein